MPSSRTQKKAGKNTCCIHLQLKATKSSSNYRYKFWEHENHPMLLDNTEMYNQRLNYLHWNPVTASYKTEPASVYSSSTNVNPLGLYFKCTFITRLVTNSVNFFQDESQRLVTRKTQYRVLRLWDMLWNTHKKTSHFCEAFVRVYPGVPTGKPPTLLWTTHKKTSPNIRHPSAKKPAIPETKICSTQNNPQNF